MNLRCHHRSGRGVGCHPFISRCLAHPCHSGKIHARYERIATGTAGAVALFGATGASKCCCFMGCLPGISMPGAGMTGWKMSRRWGDLEEHWIALDFRLRFLYFSGIFVTQMLKCLHENFGTLLDEDFLKGNCQHVEQSMDSELGRSLILSLWRTLRGRGCVLTLSVKWRNPSVMAGLSRRPLNWLTKKRFESWTKPRKLWGSPRDVASYEVLKCFKHCFLMSMQQSIV